MNRIQAAAHIALGTGLAFLLCLALALAALDFRLFSRIPQGVPPGLPGLILALALAAGSCLFLGRRIRRGRKMRLAAYQSTLGLAILSIVVLVRQVVGFFVADWPVSGSILLGMNAFALGTIGLLSTPTTRESLVLSEDPKEESEDLRAEVETLVAEIQDTYRRLPVPVPSLTTAEVIREGLCRPARAFRELRIRPHLELCWVIALLVLLWPRLTIFAGRDETVASLLQAGVDYGLWIGIYDVGKAAMFWGIAQALGQRLRYAGALGGVMIVDFPSLTSYVTDYLWRDQYVSIGVGSYSQIGIGPFITGLATTHPGVFEALAKVDLLHVWTFALWWTAMAILAGTGKWLSLVFTFVAFPAAHVFAWGADIFLHLVRWR